MDSSAKPESVASLRSQIDQIDHALVELLAERRRTVEALRAIKTTTNAPLRDAAREANMLTVRLGWARTHQLEPALVEGVFRTILACNRGATDEDIAYLTGTSVFCGLLRSREP